MRQYLILFSAIIGFGGLAALKAAPVAAQANNAQVGKRLYMRCAACHALSASAPNKVGPHLQGIVGRKSASVVGFGYSPGMRAANLTWNDATMDKWLVRPSAVVPNTTMAFAGMPDPAQRKALIAYLKKPAP